MIKTCWISIYNYIHLASERFVSRKNWEWYLLMILPLIALFSAFPSYDLLSAEPMAIFKNLLKQAENPLTDFHYPPKLHEAKITFRLFMPLLIRFLHLNIFGVLFIYFLFAIATYYIMIQFLKTLVTDKVLVLWISLTFISISAGKTGFITLQIMVYECICIFFLLLSMYSKNFLIIALSIFFAAFNNERGLIASAFVFIWHFFNNDAGIKRLLRLMSIVAAWLIYFAIRMYLGFKYNLHTPSDGADFSTLINNTNIFPIGLWTGLEGFWLLFLLAVILLYHFRQYFQLFSFLAVASLIILVSFCVDDITRSLCYLFPSIFFAVQIISKYGDKIELKKLSYMALFISALYPALTVTGPNVVMWQYPLPLQLLRIILT